MTSPRRVPNVPHATTVVMVELLPGSTAYCDTYRDAPPIVVIDTGPTEIQLSVPAGLVTLDELRILDHVIEAWYGLRNALVARLD